jgi:Concanavalin A-like lectin/glucanases superfamily
MALLFTGTQYATLENIGQSLTSNVTMEMWIKLASNSTTVHVASFHNGLGNINSFQCVVAGGTSARFNVNGPGTPGNGSAVSLTSGVWAHVAFTCAGNVTKTYVNGVQRATTTMGSTPPTSTRNLIWIAKTTATATDPLFKGAVSELRYWSLTRTASEILSNYNKEISQSTPGLVFYLNYTNIAAATSTSVIESYGGRTLSLIGSPNKSTSDSAFLSVFTPVPSLFQTADLTLTPGAVTDVLIYGQATGSIGATTASDTYTSVIWTSSAGATTITDQTLTSKTGLLAGTYTVLVQNSSSGKSATHTYTVSQPDQLVITPGTTGDCSAYGVSDGYIGASVVSGGAEDASYTWSSSAGATAITEQTPASKTGLLAGTYTLTVTDARGATASHTYTIMQPIHAEATVTNCSAYDAMDGSVEVTFVDGGSPPYSYAWSSPLGVVSPSSSSSAVYGLDALMYSAIITDTGGRTFTLTAQVTEPQMEINASTGPIESLVTWTTSSIFSLYQVSYAPIGAVSAASRVAAVTNSGQLTVTGLIPETQYTIIIEKVLNRRKSIVKPLSSISVTTTVDSIQNFQISRYLTPEGSYDLRSNKLFSLETNVADLFATGNVVKVKTHVQSVTNATAVQENEKLTRELFEAVILPFSASGSETQTIEIEETTHGINRTIQYNRESGLINVDEVNYDVGSVFRLAGHYRVSVCLV